MEPVGESNGRREDLRGFRTDGVGLGRILSLFITFEGPDGSGKTTQAQLLYEYLQERGYTVFLTREPGGTGIGDQIREVLHSLQNTEMLPQTEILLYSASRAQLVGQIIRPHLGQGEIVLCDRYADSTLAYQGYGHGLDLQVLQVITHFATSGLKPDLTFYLDIDVEKGLRRKLAAHQAGEAEWNRMDGQELAFHRRVRQGYLEMAAAEPERWVLIEATQPADVAQRAIRTEAEAKLKVLGHK
jgi:dTMP kinase